MIMTIISYCIVELLSLPSLCNPSPPLPTLQMFLLLLLLPAAAAEAVAVIVADSYRIHYIHSLFLWRSNHYPAALFYLQDCFCSCSLLFFDIQYLSMQQDKTRRVVTDYNDFIIGFILFFLGGLQEWVGWLVDSD